MVTVTIDGHQVEAEAGTTILTVAERLGIDVPGPDADLRARLAAAVVGGLLYALWVVGDETLAAAGRRELIVRYGALLQSVLTP